MRKSHRVGTHVALIPFSAPISVLISLVLSGLTPVVEVRAQSARAESLIGYSELSTNLQGGRHANVVTMRAVVSRADGTERRLVAERVREPVPLGRREAGKSFIPTVRRTLALRC